MDPIDQKPEDGNPTEVEKTTTVLDEPRIAIFQRQTWELELLVSGAIVFTLFQLPTAVDRIFFAMLPHLSDQTFWVPFFVFYYLKLVIYTLIISFTVHFTARAYWVGLVGLDAVFPKGINWKNIEYGPLWTHFYRKKLPSLSRMEKAVDRFCRSIFSFSFVIIFFLAISIVVMCVFSGITALGRMLIGDMALKIIPAILIGLFVIPGAIVQLLDKKWAKQKLDPDASSGFPNWFRRIIRFYYFGTLAPTWAPIFFSFSTNIKKKIIFPIFGVMVLFLIFLFMTDFFVKMDLVHMDSYVFYPQRPEQHSVAFRYYDELRPQDGSYARYPSISSEIVTEPFIKLFLPYRPRSDNADLRKTIGPYQLQDGGLTLAGPKTVPDHSDETVEKTLAGLAQLFDVYLNDTLKEDLEFFFYEHPQSRVKGIVTYIPTEDLPKGKNVLRIERKPELRDEDSDESETEKKKKKEKSGRQRIHTIPFWLGR